MKPKARYSACKKSSDHRRKGRGLKCPAIDGILEEGTELIDEYKGSEPLDAALIGAAQAVEHYEIARYGTLKSWADQLGLEDASALLAETLEEEEKTDEDLTALTESSVNERAQVAAE